MKTVRFVGGPKHGQIIAVHDLSPVLEFAEYRSSLYSTDTTAKIHRYHKFFFREFFGDMYIQYVHEDHAWGVEQANNAQPGTEAWEFKKMLFTHLESPEYPYAYSPPAESLRP